LTTVLNAAGVIPAFPLLIAALDISVHKLTYLIGVQILFLGIAPLFWKPIANRYGRRPIWLISSLCGGICNIGCVYSTSYGTLITTRILVAIFLSPALGLGGAVVTETFFAHQRARKLVSLEGICIGDTSC
jgi:MFS family permease